MILVKVTILYLLQIPLNINVVLSYEIICKLHMTIPTSSMESCFIVIVSILKAVWILLYHSFDYPVVNDIIP